MSRDIYTKRIWELDFLRGLAVIFMIYFHLIFDLNEIMRLPISYTTGFNYLSGRIAAYLFIIISGISCSFSRSNVKRGLKTLGCALAITLVSYFYNSQMTIYFGILHFFGVSFLLYPLINKVKIFLMPPFAMLFIIGRYLISNVVVKHNYFSPIGIYNYSFSSADYYPLIPYLGYFILGVFLGKVLYKNKRSVVPKLTEDNFLNFVGRHSLIVYLLHQPVILIVISIIQMI